MPATANIGKFKTCDKGVLTESDFFISTPSIKISQSLIKRNYFLYSYVTCCLLSVFVAATQKQLEVILALLLLP